MGTVNRQQERREMIISETWKNLLRRVTSCKRVEKDVRPAASGIHSTPAGRYPEGGPKPSKLGVLFYVISILFSLIGVITLTRYPFVSQVTSEHNQSTTIYSVSTVCVCRVFRKLVNYSRRARTFTTTCFMSTKICHEKKIVFVESESYDR